MKTPNYTISQLKEGIISQNRVIMGKALSLVESKKKEDKAKAELLLDELEKGNTFNKPIKIGISGAPGVGKSTFIDSFGEFLIEKNESIAVLTIDPSSTLSFGSILGDKTRMQSLASNPKAFIRPSASTGVLGGISPSTHKMIQLLEYAGFSSILIETVGVGQSEIEIYEMVDFFALLVLPNAGDDLQGIKRGIMEISDAILITKADLNDAKIAKANYEYSLHLLQNNNSTWQPPVLITSAISKLGYQNFYDTLQEFKKTDNFPNPLKKEKLFLKTLETELLLRLKEESRLKQLIKSKKSDLLKSNISIRQAVLDVVESYFSENI